MSKGPKKKDVSSSRVTSSPAQTPNKEPTSLVASASEGLGDLKRSRVPIWPEWNEAEVNAEKWDATKGKDAKGGKGSHTQLFEDPEGRVDLPVSLKVHSWKRPSEYLVNKVPAVVENECAFDLTTANEHLLCSELMRWIISEIYILWKACNGGIEDRPVSVETTPGAWKPWEHIYSLCKVVKGHQPLYNPYGKYVLKLYWMGAWRKVTIDDVLPFDEENKLLLPSSTNQSELWPMLLAKALIKLANTDLIPGNRRELGEFTIIHTLTGWVPEIIPLDTRCVGPMWTFLREAVPRFQLKNEDSATSPDMRNRTESLGSSNKSPEKNKDSAKRKGKDTDQGRKSQTPVTTSGQPNHNTENVMVCASYLPLKLLERKASELGKMSDSSEYLRQCGLSQLCSHPVLLTQTREGPLVAQPSAPPVPRWKLIRPRRQYRPTDEPQEPVVVKPQEFIEVASPFLNLKLKTFVTEIRSRKQTCSSALASFTEHDESEQENITDSLQSEQADAMEPAEVTAEDKKKDERPPSDQTASETQSTSVDTPPPMCVSEKPALQETWVPLEHFTHCFQTLLVFHKPNAYPHHSQKSQYKSSVSSRVSATALSSPNSTAARQSQYPEEKGSYFLVVDSLQPSEILISFSALLHWGETLEEKKELQLRCGVLTVEPFSWKSLNYQLPILSTHTTACKAAALKLQPGRHVLCFHMRAVSGFHVHLYSRTPFIFGDEEAVMPVLTKESVCFVEQAECIACALGQVVRCFSSDTERQAATRALTNTHFPPNSPRAAAGEHMKLFGEAVHEMFSRALDRRLTSQELLALQALTLQPCPACSHTHSHTHAAAAALEHGEQPGERSERSPTEAEERAAVTLQAGLRGYAARRMVRTARPGTKENLSAAKTLQEMWASVETDLKKHAISLLGYMFRESPSCVDLYSCRGDEKSRISFSEYSVTLPDTPNIWALIFREVFFVPKDTLLVAKVCSPVVSALHVINNDTGQEMPKVFHRVEPHVYKSNQNGYTFVAEAHTGDVPIGRWRMNLIGCRQPLPVPARETPVNSFCVNEFKDYYIPNDKYIICRFSVKVSVDVVGTVQFQTSAPHVHLRLSVLDHEDALTSATGKGQVIIPVFTFSADPDSEESQEKEDSEETDTHTHAEPAPAPPSSHTHAHAHKYVVQVEVLHRSWAVSEAEAAFIQTLRHAERNEIRVSPGGDKPEEVTAPSSTDQSSNEGQKSTTPKSSRKTKEKEKDKEKEKEKPVAKPGSRLEQVFDVSKPHWTLRVVCEQTEAESVCVKRDTERQEQIKALKMAWESADPGRAVKALQSRLQFINKCVRGLTGDGPTDGADRRDSVFQQSPDFQDMNLFNAAQFAPMDYTPYIRRTRSRPLLKDEAIAERQRVERSERIQEFRLQRDMVLERRQQERAARRQLKRGQIQLYDAIQISLWEQRRRVLEAREEFRQRLLVEETQRLEEEAAHEALRQMEQEKNQAQAPARKSAAKKK